MCLQHLKNLLLFVAQVVFEDEYKYFAQYTLN